MQKTLVVGATGVLGRTIVSSLLDGTSSLRAMVRPTRNNDATQTFSASGVELARGDLKDRTSLETACRGVRTVISTATSTSSRLVGDSIETVDEEGQASLVQVAREAGVERFVFVSFAASPLDFALQRAKRGVEELLRASGMAYTILQPSYFMEGWLSPKLGFDPVGGRARLFGGGLRKVSWVSVRDVARFAAAAAEGDRMIGRTVPLGGPEALSQRDVLDIYAELGGPPVTVEDVPEDLLERQRLAAPDTLQEAFAALMIGVARGQTIDPEPALALAPGRLVTVRDLAARATNALRTNPTA
jgi:uncharacterized protein YbjT (DUF2867 family)